MALSFISVLSILAAIALTVILCVKVLPAKYDGTFSKKLPQQIHDYFNFKHLYLETILKFLFVFLTIACIIVGLLTATIGNALQFISNLIDAIDYDYMGSWIWRSLFANLFGGLALAVIGPVVIRLVYEGLMMFILLVKNVIDINGKIKAPEKENPKTEE